jgi:hypothetical protein
VTDLFANRAAKLIRLLSSDRDGEALAALRSLHKAMAEAKLDHHWLANVVQNAWSERTTPPPRRWHRWHPRQAKSPSWEQWRPHSEPELQPWEIMATDLLRHHGNILGMRGSKFDESLRNRESSFLNNMKNAKTEPSDFQKKWLRDINNRVRRAA